MGKVCACNQIGARPRPLLDSSAMRFATIALLPLIVLGSACKSTPAEQPPAPASAATSAAPPPAPLTFGQHHHPIRTSNPEAQKMFDQGLAQAFGFNHEAAIMSFDRAAELDPSAAMPLWGKAWALGPNYNLDIDDTRAKAAYDALVKAQSLAAAGPETRRRTSMRSRCAIRTI